jgi:hypothetical protein
VPEADRLRSRKGTFAVESLGAGLGDRFEVSRGGSGLFKKGCVGLKNQRIAAKARQQALFLVGLAVAQILHGKEGVDGSSPSEGLKYLQID